MSSEAPSIKIDLTPRFKRELRQLAKRYRAIRRDLQPLIEQLQAGSCPGDRVSGLQETVFKVRLRNSNIQKGKSGGYRVIYYLKQENNIILITIYSKSDISDISDEIVKEAIARSKEEIPVEED